MGLGGIFGTTAAITELLRLSPQLIEAARETAQRFRAAREREAGEDPAVRMARLEALLEEHGQLLQSLADEVQRTQAAVREAEVRTGRLAILSGCAAVISCAALVTLFVR